MSVEITFASIVALTVILTQIVKYSLKKYEVTDFIPAVAVVIGVAVSILVDGLTREALLVGLVIGTTAAGTFDFVERGQIAARTVYGAITQNKPKA